MTNKREPEASPAVTAEGDNSAVGRQAAKFDGYDSFDSLYVVSKLTLNVDCTNAGLPEAR